MAIQDTWFTNLKALVTSEGGGRRGIRSVADVTGLSEEYVYQLVERKPDSRGLAREIGKVAAKKIAKGFAAGRGEDWFDTLASSPTTQLAAPHTLQDALRIVAMSLDSADKSDRDAVKAYLVSLCDDPRTVDTVAAKIERLLTPLSLQSNSPNR